MSKTRLDPSDLLVTSFPAVEQHDSEPGGTYFPECNESFSICKTCHSCGFTDCACTGALLAE